MLTAITMGDVSTAAGLATLFGGLAAAGYLRTVLSQLKDSNAELRAEVSDLERRAASDRSRCDREIAELSGRVSVMTSEWARDVAREIAAEWRRMRTEEKP
jgi:hypothetical protein